jgi:endonuclease YncB( thermonuclease family)
VVVALVALALTGARDRGPQVLAVAPDAQAALRALWHASVAARAERVACLASAVDGDTLRITRVNPLTVGADSLAVSAGSSIELCGPPSGRARYILTSPSPRAGAPPRGSPVPIGA